MAGRLTLEAPGDVGDVVAWANVELTKNAAEIGYARVLYAVSARPDRLVED